MIHDTNDSCEGYAWGPVWHAAYVLTPNDRPSAKRRTCEASRHCGQNERPSRWHTRPCESVVSRDVRTTRTRGRGRFVPSPQLTIELEQHLRGELALAAAGEERQWLARAQLFLHALHRTRKRGFKCV